MYLYHLQINSIHCISFVSEHVSDDCSSEICHPCIKYFKRISSIIPVPVKIMVWAVPLPQMCKLVGHFAISFLARWDFHLENLNLKNFRVQHMELLLYAYWQFLRRQDARKSECSPSLPVYICNGTVPYNVTIVPFSFCFFKSLYIPYIFTMKSSML